ncbi:LuxR C-terminal-related transcriptional regulator [Pseudomonas saliphila]|uniref:LuxR C-terminal-related transcriptional regulator n=1 Tax=Pseudomonas saliphila TaxID=2586906 RepID=UPI0015B42764|nr:LuxR C-terminal-related transcriptional regulator [Pseudomonas saliphila]
MQNNPAIDSVGLQLELSNYVRRAKLAAPSLASRNVTRSDIPELARRAADAKLVLFRAPAGFGKTTAMRQYLDYLQAEGRRVVWLTLDYRDDDFRRFLAYLIDAFDLILRPAECDAERYVAPVVTQGIDQLALKLVDRVADCEHPFTLFIDEFESVSNHSIDDLLRVIINHLPAGGQLAIASRETPNLQLGRLRAQGQLVEVDQMWLRFSRAEAEFFFRTQRGLKLSEAGISKVYGDTEGWPAALWLVSMALEVREDPEAFISTFSSSSSIMTEYLIEAFLSSQPEDIQSFLLKSSILSELSRSLCDAVCGRNDSDRVLARLEHSNVCVTTLDGGERNLYRYHGLFAAFLRDQLQRQYPQEIANLHLNAAKWYEAEGRPIPAIEHALASGMTDYALSLIASRSDSLLFDGRFRLLARWLDALPDESLRLKPRLRLARIWALTFTRRGTEALRRLEELDNDKGALANDEISTEVDALRPYILAILDRHEEGFWLAEEVLHTIPKRESFCYAVLSTTLATWRVAANRYSDAIELLTHASLGGGGQNATFPTVYTMCLQGLVSLAQGRVREAIAHFRVALGEAEVAFGSRSVGRSIAAVYLAEALYDTDELEEAEQLLALYLPIVKEYALPDQLIISHVIYARIAHNRGDLDHCYHSLSELEYFGRQNNLPRVIASAHLERARMALLRGDLIEAKNQCERAEDPAAWTSLRGMVMPANDLETTEICRFRLFVYGYGEVSIVDSIKAEIRTAQNHSRNRRVLKLKILLAKALHMSGQLRMAMRMIQECAETACNEGLSRTFLEEGPPIFELIRELRLAMQIEGKEQGDELTLFIDHILLRGGYNLDLDDGEGRILDASISLSEREANILEFVSFGLSNNSIAEKLFVTESTVRSHLRKINNKLGANNRTQAVNMARRLGLIR